MLEIIKNTKIDFIKYRFVGYVISAIFICAGLYSSYLISAGKANMGLDFTGGTSVQVKFSKEIKVEKIREIAEKAGFKNLVIQQVGKTSDYEFMIRLGSQELEAGSATERIKEILAKGSGDAGIIVESASEIGPLVSAQLKQKAFLAVFWALVGILVYIWIRFQFKFAVAATFATFHDVMAMLALVVLTGKEVDLIVITALLTIAGYSLTDTVVVFDRIRENLRYVLKLSFPELVNKSINEVLSRSLITSLTTLFVVVSLYLFGGEVLKNFSYTLMVGIIVATYSSIFVASPIIVEWDNFEKRNKAAK